MAPAQPHRKAAWLALFVFALLLPLQSVVGHAMAIQMSSMPAGSPPMDNAAMDHASMDHASMDHAADPHAEHGAMNHPGPESPAASMACGDCHGSCELCKFCAGSVAIEATAQVPLVFAVQDHPGPGVRALASVAAEVDHPPPISL